MSNNKLTIKVDADTSEALKQMKEVTEAANECVGALEKLEKVLGRLRGTRGIIESGVINLKLNEKLYFDGVGTLPVKND
ncbi:hypothetical protein NLU03_10750 [Bacillus toyonensis]|nr:hypothetical protein [Bacillus toyonensis]